MKVERIHQNLYDFYRTQIDYVSSNFLIIQFICIFFWFFPFERSTKYNLQYYSKTLKYNLYKIRLKTKCFVPNLLIDYVLCMPYNIPIVKTALKHNS